MSSDQTPTPRSADAQSPTPAKKRNPIERVIVWGLIVVLVAVSAREAVARFGYTNSLNSLQAALEADDEGQTLMLEQVPAHLSGGPRQEKNDARRVVSYHWSGLLKDYGSIHIQYSNENEVLGLLTADAPPIPEPVFSDEEDLLVEADELLAEIGAAGAPAEGQTPGGGRRGFDFAAADADGDGKLSLEEAPDRMKERFAEIDTSGDGFIDEEELAASRAARNRDGGGRPQRPERPADTDDAAGSADEDASTADTPEQKPADANADEPAATEESAKPEDESAEPADQPSPQ